MIRALRVKCFKRLLSLSVASPCDLFFWLRGMIRRPYDC